MDKPKIGSPCVGCGLCCRTQVCMNGAYVMKLVKELGDTVPGPCPAIVEINGKVQCGILINPKKYIKTKKYPEKVLRKYFAFLIGAGNGCDELGFGYNPEEESRLSELLDAITSNPDFDKKMKIAVRVIHGYE
ncbi:MAG: hypothetical protein RR220_07980 [Bacteroidaceae bacterium]